MYNIREKKMKTYGKLAVATLVSLIPFFISVVLWSFHPIFGYFTLVFFIIFLLLGLGLIAEGQND